MSEYLPEIAIAAALAWASGIRLYATLFIVGLAGKLGWVVLPEHLEILASPLVLTASGFMTFVELFADKIAWLDSVWDAINTFLRIPGGALLAAAAVGDSGAGAALAAAIIGGTITAGTHFAKAGARAVVNTSPEPFSNILKSTFEDLLVPAGPVGCGDGTGGLSRRAAALSRSRGLDAANALARRTAGRGTVAPLRRVGGLRTYASIRLPVDMALRAGPAYAVGAPTVWSPL
ncbi:MAG TPA: DUF4126 domain-containing protein [Burkholderiales bacterium]|nr:DUF4126 domain-containing protein [Burkholderiales bacterium]